jgi:hypothetical protein
MGEGPETGSSSSSGSGLEAGRRKSAMKTYMTPWETFPTDVTSPTPTQLLGPKPESQKARADAPPERSQPDAEREQEKDSSE